MVKIFIAGPEKIYDQLNEFAYEHFSDELKIPGVINFVLRPSPKEIKGEKIHQVYILLPKDLDEEKMEKWMNLYHVLVERGIQTLLVDI